MDCKHCGTECPDLSIELDGLYFCCDGCKTVYSLLNSSDFEQYYQLKESGGSTRSSQKDFSHLDSPEIAEKLYLFARDSIRKIKFHIPAIHCTACLWLLEKLPELRSSIKGAKVNFIKKELTIDFDLEEESLSDVVGFIALLGYEPKIQFDDLKSTDKPKKDKSPIYRIGVAGFCFGNIMLLSFPEYLGESFANSEFKAFFGYINWFLALPLLFYCAQPFFKSAYQELKFKRLNLDVPIVLGILVLFGRSSFEILTESGAGYMDSLAGFLFFLLLGNWYKSITFDQLHFERDYRSFFPIAVQRKTTSGYASIPISKIEKGDKIRVNNGEIIPTDSVLFSESAEIDYSFITGESEWITVPSGERIYAGGKVIGKQIELEVVKSTNQSYLTDLWNGISKEHKSNRKGIIDWLSKYFTIGVILLAFIGFLIGWQESISEAITIFSSVLIVACPCALALSAPFTLGTAMRLLGEKGIYIKNTESIEALAKCDTIILDKTGTLTINQSDVLLTRDLSDEQKDLLFNLTIQSNHPKSKSIVRFLGNRNLLMVEDFKEITGQGLEGKCNGQFIELKKSNQPGKTDFLINEEIITAIEVETKLRSGIQNVLTFLENQFQVMLASGDTDKDTSKLKKLLPASQLLFNQKPEDKKQLIQNLKLEGKEPIMLGDGLNDSGALLESSVGIVIADDTNNFTPASDIIIDAKTFQQIPQLIRFSRNSIRVVKLALTISLIYNCIGLLFALSGNLSPIVAAILMPLSSITVVLTGVVVTKIVARNTFKNLSDINQFLH